MKLSLAVLTIAAVAPQTAVAFAPSTFSKSPQRSFVSQRSVVPDASILADAHQHMDSISSFISSITISDLDITDVTDAVTETVSATAAVVTPEPAAVVDVVASAATAATDAVVDAAPAAADNGWFGFLEGPIEGLLGTIHGALVSVGMPANAWGITIITMTALIKLGTYPLTKQQLESTGKMQALQPTIKDVQAKYASNPEVMNQKISEIYQTNEVNPLAGCLPAFAQIPIFIGLYRAVLTLAKDNKLNEPFLFLPNLEGPTYGADPAHGIDWIMQGWVDGVPSLGWEDTIAFLSIPVILVVSQSFSMNLMATKDQEQPAFLKFLPLLIGWFSLSVPAALGIYWVANNIITTALTLQIRSGLTVADPVAPAAAGGGSVVDVSPSTFTPAPMREKPAGFGAAEIDVDEMTPITATDATIVEDATVLEQSSDSKSKKPKRGKKKKKKRKN